MPHPRRRGCPRVEAGVVALARYIGPGLPPPKYIPASAVEDAQPSCSAVMHDARQHETPEHVRCADLSLLHDFGPFTSCPAKKLNPKLIASRCLRYCAFEFVQSATLWERLKRPRRTASLFAEDLRLGTPLLPSCSSCTRWARLTTIKLLRLHHIIIPVV
jgi:hypothetical protein